MRRILLGVEAITSHQFAESLFAVRWSRLCFRWKMRDLKLAPGRERERFQYEQPVWNRHNFPVACKLSSMRNEAGENSNRELHELSPGFRLYLPKRPCLCRS